MAKRELSNTLKNLKFMQRAAPREEKINEEKENPEPIGNVFSTANAASSARRRCIVILEGDPHPGALRGRMSFQSFNPSIDKLNEEATTIHQSQATNTSMANDNISYRSELKGGSQEDISDPELKRKQPVADMEISAPGKFQNTGNKDANGKSSPQNSNSSNKQKKREKLDWNLLRPPKAQKKRS
ncbi:uncharacterized protein LOC110022876 [Phalaenopsis equestris]|uniref:uncharacterized protein LOC110022876 n=1 Tax=Phalaenopsis equestris TaxID=78828 RepID=UPI0009E5A8F7|nr:uncharacterized protein LOC110022876 [Phalaenopsis equestris]